LDLSTFLVVLSGKNKKIGFYFSDKRSIEKIRAILIPVYPYQFDPYFAVSFYGLPIG
jgi:hypothetical protein